ncbi:WXG100 family type VII secretion target [Williamsia phyllosphaerae]|uniref:ESAT-6-like protein n=1 Tax=Williamsia phyllosphaerae TaxID=885042 RepID=A0ABQ1U3C9_9NOCA|nr:hypothetical protein [Williamsia phyllosphaerae]GGF08126.1 hypothetical protein GCM10007298_00040 [Williamsia phyllosphaerae]
MSDTPIVYSAGVLEHLNDIKARENEFTGLVQEMEGLRNQVMTSWNQESSSAAAFHAAHRKWTADVEEIQQVLRSIIARATDGVGDMASTEKSVASMFHG